MNYGFITVRLKLTEGYNSGVHPPFRNLAGAAVLLADNSETTDFLGSVAGVNIGKTVVASDETDGHERNARLFDQYAENEREGGERD